MGEQQKDFTITMIFILAIVVVLIIVMSSSGLFDEKASQFRSRAEFVCWDAGYFGGVDEFKKINASLYEFTCKEVSFWNKFDGRLNIGFLGGELK